MNNERFDFWRNAIDEEKIKSLEDTLGDPISITILPEERFIETSKYLLIDIKINRKKWPNWLNNLPYGSLKEKTNKIFENYEDILPELIDGKIKTIFRKQKRCIFQIYKGYGIDTRGLRERLISTNWELIQFSEFPYKLQDRYVKYIKETETLKLPRNIFLHNEKVKMKEDRIAYNKFFEINIPSFSGTKIYLVQGPPGTGKTFDLVRICKNIHENPKYKKCRVLISGYTHASVRNIIKEFEKKSLPFITINIHGLDDDYEKYDIDNKVEEAMIKRKLAKELEEELRAEMIYNAKFTFCTAMGAPSQLSKYNVSYNIIAIDEVGLNFLPIISRNITLLRENGIVLLYGDPDQLPPVVKKRLLSHDNYKYHENPLNKTVYDVLPLTKFLDKQYRGRPEIFWLVSALFYSGEIKTPKTKIVPSLGDFPILKFIECKKSSSEDFRRENRAEISISNNLLSQISEISNNIRQDEFSEDSISVSVITPFRVQANLLIEKVKSNNDNIDILNGTVHVLQGQTRDIVIGSIAAKTFSKFLNPFRSWIYNPNENNGIYQKLDNIFNLLERDSQIVKKSSHYNIDYREVLQEIKEEWKKYLEIYIKQESNIEKGNKIKSFYNVEYEIDKTPPGSNYFAPNLFNVLFSRARKGLVIIANPKIVSINPILRLTNIWFNSFTEFWNNL